MRALCFPAVALCLAGLVVESAPAQPPGPPEVVLLLEKLGAKDPSERAGAVERLGRLGTEARPAVPALSRLLAQDPSSFVRERSAQALARIAKDVKADPGKAVAALGKALKDRDRNVRIAAANALGSLGAKARPAVPALIEALRDPNGYVRAWVAEALVRTKAPPEQVIPPLVQALATPNYAGRIGNALAGLGPVVVAPLEKALASDDPHLRQGAASALADLGPKAKEAVPELAELVRRDPAPAVRKEAASALGRIGREAASATPALTEALQSKELEVRRAAAQALSRVARPEQLDVALLRKTLQDEDWEIRWFALKGLRGSELKAEQLKPVLVQALKDPAGRVVYEAAQGLSALGPDAHDAIPAIVEALHGTGYVAPMLHLRPALAGVLGRMGRPAVAPLTKALHAENSQVQGAAASALGQIGKEARPAVPTLLDVLRASKDERLRATVMSALGRIGDEAAVPALREAAKSPNEDVRRRAEEALRRLRGEEEKGPSRR